MAERLKSGHILRVPLSCNRGFAYAKYINILNVAGNNSYPDLIKIFDYRSSVDEQISTSYLNDYLMQPILLAGRLPILREQRWQIVGELPILPEDGLLPDFRVPEYAIADRMSTPRQPKSGNTFYTQNVALGPLLETAIPNVAHLESLSAKNADMIETATTMCLMINEGLNVAEYFDLSDPDYEYVYSIYGSRPLANSIPKHLYGRARQQGEEGYVL
ncbi:Imm26 family immunity protein [Hymenobacter sp. IS2118]|uniref:Imm26 family immunity protein n=1 Tax=Hymenobacter sp. IS2118 TaxID=1505605 RepID=UPI00055662D0|nr:Imm26 family immunity protein [Hymenobacter sp. IS2118]